MEEVRFRTPVDPTPWEHTIRHHSGVLSVGSCFAETIGSRLLENKFRCAVNPFGVIYNPLSIHGFLNHAAEGHGPSRDSFLERDGNWFSYDAHSCIHATASDRLREHLDQAVLSTRTVLEQSEFLFITYGTAWVFRRQDTGAVVANCHKMPARNFSRELLKVEDITDSFSSMLERLVKVRPDIRVILTVSPVRHLADSAEGNAVSKSIVRLACSELISQHPNVLYFPAFEIMMDDLRDYRFYAPDMIHPSSVAVDYIWTLFQRTACTDETRSLTEAWQRLKRSLEHRAFHPGSEAHIAFLKRLLDDLRRLSAEINLGDEIGALQKQLNQVGAEPPSV